LIFFICLWGRAFLWDRLSHLWKLILKNSQYNFLVISLNETSGWSSKSDSCIVLWYFLIVAWNETYVWFIVLESRPTFGMFTVGISAPSLFMSLYRCLEKYICTLVLSTRKRTRLTSLFNYCWERLLSLHVGISTPSLFIGVCINVWKSTYVH